MKKMKPILFNTEMVRAILDGRKTVTRRSIKDVNSNAKMIGWSANPWVWVYEFEVISKDEAMKESE